MSTNRLVHLLFVFAFFTITACSSSAPTPTIVPPTNLPTITPSPQTPLDAKIDVGGYALRIRCIGQGSPTVIVEAGFGEAPVESNTWIGVTSAIVKTTRICVYDRAGLGSSDDASIQTRTSKDVVQDLHTLLVNARMSSPYILVGHSIGGFHVLLFTDTYPKEVAGMVLVDSSHPDQWTEVSKVLPAESPDEPPIFKTLRTIPDSHNEEKLDVATSAEQVREVKSLGTLPLVVLTHSPAWHVDPSLSPELATQIDEVWQSLQDKLASLSTKSTHVIATRAGHYIQLDEPQLVIDAILKVIHEVKK